MQRTEKKFLTTHAGSLPRPPQLTELFAKLSRREEVDPAALAQAIEESTLRSIEQQLLCGIDVGNNGEQPRESFFTYVQHRMSGFGGTSNRPIMRDIVEYPTFAALKLRDLSKTMVNLLAAPKAVADVAYVDRKPIEKECADFRRLMGSLRLCFVESFFTAPSPGIIASAMLNEHYPSYGKYLMAVAEALRVEYEYVTSQGFVLQLDCPDLALSRHMVFAHLSLAEFRKVITTHVEALNHAVRDLPPERMRMHICWASTQGPHHKDVPLKDIVDIVLKGRPQAVSFPGANPRHGHEWKVWKDVKLPEGKIIIPGVIDSTSNFVEHPELVADRIVQYASVVGRENVIAGVDCGFGTFAGRLQVDSKIVWMKLASLAEGAQLASKQLR
jgi:5-methyltetrahydropteroyltriglutamate--homocysteine methyltransferase